MLKSAVQHEPDGVWAIQKWMDYDEGKQEMKAWEDWCEKMNSYCETHTWTSIPPEEIREALENDRVVYPDELGRV